MSPEQAQDHPYARRRRLRGTAPCSTVSWPVRWRRRFSRALTATARAARGGEGGRGRGGGGDRRTIGRGGARHRTPTLERGGMPERPNGAVSKTAVSSNGHRGFKSHSLRQADSE